MLKEAIRNIIDAIYYGFATWLYNSAGFIANNKYKFIGVGFLILGLLAIYLPNSEAKIIALISFFGIGLGLIFRKGD